MIVSTIGSHVRIITRANFVTLGVTSPNEEVLINQETRIMNIEWKTRVAIAACALAASVAFSGCSDDENDDNPDVTDTDGGETIGDGTDSETIGDGNDGETTPFACNADSVFDDDGNQICAVKPRTCNPADYADKTVDDYVWPDDLGILEYVFVNSQVPKGVSGPPIVTCDYRVMPDCNNIQELSNIVNGDDDLDGKVICFADATYYFTSEVTLGASFSGASLQGVGDGYSLEEIYADANTPDDRWTKLTAMDENTRTVLDFSGAVQFVANGDQTECFRTGEAKAIGVKNAENITFRDLHILDAPGDALETTDCTNVAMLGVATTWTVDACEYNGAYGLYPVKSTGVIIEHSYVQGSADAGIYVGQSDQVLVRNSHAYKNVAGIEIENTTAAEVVGNYAYDNTGGMLIFNLPGIEKQGFATKLHDNNFSDNNGPNFADPNTSVGQVPPGTGVMILANDRNDVYNNLVDNNGTVAVLIVSYSDLLNGGNPFSPPVAYNRLSEDNCIRDNILTNNGGGLASGVGNLTSGIITGAWRGFRANAANGIPADATIPEIIVDGCETELTGDLSANWTADDLYLPPTGGSVQGDIDAADSVDSYEINHFFNNTFTADAGPTFASVDLCNDFANPSAEPGDRLVTETCNWFLPSQTGRTRSIVIIDDL